MDEKTFEEVINEYGARIFNIAFRIVGRREEAEDAVQETFLQAYRGLENFRDESSPYTWLYRIAVRTALRIKRKIEPAEVDSVFANAGTFENDIPAEIEDWKNNPEKQTLYEELIRQVREGCLHFMSFRLTPEQRAMYMLRYVMDFSYKEIEDMMEIPMASVKARLNRIRNKVESFFVDECEWLCERKEKARRKSSCSCDKKIGIALALKPELLRNVKVAALEHDASSSVGSVLTEQYPDIHSMYNMLRDVSYDPDHLKTVIKNM